MTNEFKETIRELIRKAKTDKALQELLNWAHRNNDAALTDKVSELTAQLKKTNNDVMYGYITDNEADVKQRRLVKTILDLLQETDRKPTPVPMLDNKPLKILMLTANPANTTLLNLDKEYADIITKLESRQEQFMVLRRKAVSGTEFKEFTETIKPDILHFSGHGEGGTYAGIVVQNDDKNEEELIGIDGLDALFEYFKEKFNIQIVLLNACYSEEQAKTISKYVPYVIGTNVSIGDKAANAFSSGFYFILAQSKDVNIIEAFKSGRTDAVMKGAKKPNFVLYQAEKQVTI